MAWQGCSSGWWTARSRPMCRCGTSRRATMASSAGPTSSSTSNVTSMFVRAVQTLPAPATSNKDDCSACSLTPRCTTAAMRKVTRDVDEEVRDRVRALANTEAFQQSRHERKKVEMRFAHMKRILKLDRLRLRGLSGAKDEVLLTATAQNLRRLAKLLCRASPPVAAASLA